MTTENNKSTIPRLNRPRSDDDGGDYIPEKKTMNPMILMAIAVAISVLLSFWWVNNATAGLVSKGDIEGLTQSINETDKSVNTAISNLPNTIKSQVDSGVNSALTNINKQISSIQTDVATIKDQAQSAIGKATSSSDGVTSINAKIDEMIKTNTTLTDQIKVLQTQLANDEARIKALETPTTTTTKVLKLEIVQPNENLITSLDKKSITTQFKVILTNSNTVDVEDIILGVLIETELLPVTTNSVVTMISTPSMNWTRSGWLNYEMEFHNGWGLTVKASDKKTIYFTLTISDPDAVFTSPAYGYNLGVQIE